LLTGDIYREESQDPPGENCSFFIEKRRGGKTYQARRGGEEAVHFTPRREGNPTIRPDRGR